MHFHLFIQAAQIGMTNIMPYLAFVVSIVGVIYSAKSFNERIKKDKIENDRRMATKSFVLDQLSKPETEISLIREDIKEFKLRNDSDHSSIKEDITKHFDTRFDDFKDFMIELHKKSG